MSIEDRAQEIEAQDWERNNKPRAVRALFDSGEEGYGPSECAECGDDMPALRRAMGRDLCTLCTDLLDRRKKQRAT